MLCCTQQHAHQAKRTHQALVATDQHDAVLCPTGTTTNKDMFKGWELPKKRPTVGIAMVGDQQHVLIPSTLTVPCHGKQIFTTVHDNQPHMSFVIYAGESRVASSNRQLGQFQLKGVPPAPFGVPQIEVTHRSLPLPSNPKYYPIFFSFVSFVSCLDSVGASAVWSGCIVSSRMRQDLKCMKLSCCKVQGMLRCRRCCTYYCSVCAASCIVPCF